MKNIILMLFLAASVKTFSQEQSYSFSLQEAITFALENNRAAKNASRDVEAAEKQPPAMKGKNKTDKKVDIDNLSIDEFDALPAETLRRMRGDFG